MNEELPLLPTTDASVTVAEEIPGLRMDKQRTSWQLPFSLSRHLPRVETLRWGSGVYLLVLGMSFLFLPPTPLGVWLHPLWLVGAWMLLSGLSLLWMTVLSLPLRLSMTLSVLLVIPLLVVSGGYAYLGGVAAAVTLAFFSLGMLLIPLAQPASQYEQRDPRPDAFGLLLGAAAAVQGVVFLLSPNAATAIPVGLGLGPVAVGLILLVSGCSVMVAQCVPATPGPLLWLAHLCCGLALLGLQAAIAIFVNPLYWVLGIAVTVRGVATIILPWWSQRAARFDRTAFRPRLALALATAALVPVVIAVPLVLSNIPQYSPALTMAREIAFVISLLVMLLASLGGWWLAGIMTGPLIGLIHAVNRVAGGEYELSLPRQGTSELQSLSQTVQQMAHQRQEAEQRILAERQRFYDLLMQAPAAVSIVRGPSFKIEFVNPMALKVWGRMSEQLLNKPLLDALPELRGQGFEMLLEGVLVTGIPYVGQNMKIVIDRKGLGGLEECYFTFVYTPLRQANGDIDGIMTFAYEVTDQVLARRKAEISEERLRIALQGSQIRMYQQDSDLRYTWTYNLVPEYTDAELIEGEEAEHLTALKRHVLDTGQRHQEVIQVTNRAGRRYVDLSIEPLRASDGSIAGVTGAAVDITEQKRVEQLLIEQNQLLELVQTGRPLEDCLNELTGAAARLQPGIRASVLLADVTRTKFHASYAADLPPSFGSGLKDAPINDLAIGTCGTAVFSGQPVTCTDITHDERWSKMWRELCIAHGILACHSTPVFSATGEAVASLMLCFPEQRGPSEWELRIAEFGAHVASIVIDRELAAQALNESKAKLSEELADTKQLQRISSQLIEEDRIDELYEQILDAAISLTRADFGSLQILVPEKNELLLLTWKGFDPAAAVYWQWVSLDSTSFCAAALCTGERVIVSDVESSDLLAGTEDLHFLRISGIKAVQSTPLMSRHGRIVGMFSTHWRQPHEPSDRELRLLDVLSRQAADLIVRRGVEMALRESEERFRALAENIPNLAWMAKPDGWIYWYNSRWYEYTGTTPDQMQGWGWQSVHDPQVLPFVLERWKRSLLNGEAFDMVFPLKGADGVFRPFLTRIVPIRDAQGRLLHWFGTNTDISELKRLEQLKDDFLGVASHELKTPVTSLKGYAQLLERRFRQDGDTRSADLLHKMDAQLDKLTGLVEDLLDVTKIENGQLEMHFTRFNYNALVTEVVEELQHAAPRHSIELHVDEPVSLYADRDRIGQVLTNLLSNAIKYSPQAERVIVETRRTDTDIMTSVRDFGIGIAEEKQAHLFERFYRVDGDNQLTYPGLGLGLYISAEFVKRHQGSIWVQSEPESGTTVSFTLPLHRVPVESKE